MKITDENPYEMPMRIYPAVHYTMGGLWVDYNLMTTVPGMYALGEANFSDHGANRLGVCFDARTCRRILRYSIYNWFLPQQSDQRQSSSINHEAFVAAENEVKSTSTN